MTFFELLARASNYDWLRNSMDRNVSKTEFPPTSLKALQYLWYYLSLAANRWLDLSWLRIRDWRAMICFLQFKNNFAAQLLFPRNLFNPTWTILEWRQLFYIIIQLRRHELTSNFSLSISTKFHLSLELSATAHFKNYQPNDFLDYSEDSRSEKMQTKTKLSRNNSISRVHPLVLKPDMMHVNYFDSLPKVIDVDILWRCFVFN